MTAPEPREIRLKRLRIRSVRRGIREMDLLFGWFSRGLAELSDAELDGYESLLDENDQQILAWITRQEPMPARHSALLARVVAAAPADFEPL